MCLYYLKFGFRFHIFIFKIEVIEKRNCKMFSYVQNLVTLKCSFKYDFQRMKKENPTRKTFVLQ